MRVKIKSEELAIFTWQLLVAIEVGLPLVESLEILADNQQKEKFGWVLLGVRSAVESGDTLAKALRRYPKVFDELYTSIIEALEASGVLDYALGLLGSEIRKEAKFRRAVESALICPATARAVAAVILLLVSKVAPTLTNLSVRMGVDLPLPTRAVIGLRHAVASFAWLAALGTVVLSFVLRQCYWAPRGRHAIDALILRVPVFGSVIKQFGVERLTRTLGTLLSNGVPLVEAMPISARICGNTALKKALLDPCEALQAGRTVADSLRESRVFPGTVLQLLNVGEQTGALDSMLRKVANFYEDELEQAVANLLAAIQAVTIAFLGLGVGGVLISIYLPLLSLMGKLTR